MGRKPTAQKPPSKGRQKIEIKRIMVENHRQVTYSKRRSGLFKKASELCTLCGAEVAIIVFSPAHKVFSFGHPDVDTIVDRFLARNHQQQGLQDRGRSAPPLPLPPPPCGDGGGAGAVRLVEAQRKSAGAHELNVQLTRALGQLEAEKKRGEALEEVRKAGRSQFWWERPVEELGLHELQELRVHLEDLKRNVVRQANLLFLEATHTNTTPFFSTTNDAMGMVVGGGGSYDTTLSYEAKVLGLNNAGAPSMGGSPVHNFNYGFGLF